MALISAHRAGAGDRHDLENTLEAIEASIALGAEYIEIDVRLGVHGSFIVSHDETDEPDVLEYDAALEAIKGRAKLHLDLKMVSAPEAYYEPDGTLEVAATKRAIEILGEENVVVTTMEDQSVLAIREWAAADHPELLVGLSLGRAPVGETWIRTARILYNEVFPARRLELAAPNLIVCHSRLARFTVAAAARKRGLPLLVWTVDDPATLRYWLHPGRAWMVTTNYPARALAIRSVLDQEADQRN